MQNNAMFTNMYCAETEMNAIMPIFQWLVGENSKAIQQVEEKNTFWDETALKIETQR